MKKPPEFGNRIYSKLQSICITFNFPLPSVEWSSNMTYTLGKAFTDPPRIRLSSWLSEVQALETLKHELAHLAVHFDSENHKDSPHGKKWKLWAVKLGAIPKARSPIPPANLCIMPATFVVTGLACTKCGERFLRQRIRKNLYHKPCGAKAGELKSIIKGPYHEVKIWMKSGNRFDVQP